MPIIINYNICDNAPACGGIEVCPTGAFYYDKKEKRVVVDETKCIKCLKCTLPNVCPVNCIYYARDNNGTKILKDMFAQDPRTYKWLWSDRYGCAAAKFPPKAHVLHEENFDEVIAKKGYKLIDVWHPEFVDCRAFSPLFSEILYDVDDVDVYKMNAKRYERNVKRLNVGTFPSLLLYKDGTEIYKFEGLMKEGEVKSENKKIKTMVKK